MVVVVLVLGFLVLFGAYFLGRFAVARSSGVRGFRATLGIRDEAWEKVSLARRVGTSAAGFFGYYLGVATLIALGLLMSGESIADESSMRVSVSPDGPAARAGVLNGDRIVAVGDTATPSWVTLKTEVARYAGQPVIVRVERDGAEKTLMVTPAGSGVATGKILVGPLTEKKEVTLGSALGRGLTEPFHVVAVLGRGLVRTFAGSEHPELSGPVGIVRETSRAADNAVGDGLRLVGAVAAYLFYIALIVSVLTVPRPLPTGREQR